MLFKREKGPFLYKDPSLPFEARVEDLVKRLTLKEKVGMVSYNSPAVKRLGIQKYHWWNECLHGVGRAGIATVFPQSIGLGATFNPPLIFEMAKVISDEARAKHHEFVRHNSFKIYQGLTFWSPNINIFRDPRWGRGQETYGEDPYLTGRMGVNFIKGLQGDDPKYLKVVATSKHYAVHSGPESDRHHFNAEVNQKDLRETYLPQFKESIKEAHAYSVMGAYNRTNGEPCCASPTLIQKILRDEWGFDGYYVSDCGAVWDFHSGHKVTKNVTESAALGIREGLDLCCGFQYRFLNNAVRKKLITEEEITRSVSRVMLARFKLGMFDPPELCKYQNIPYSVNDSDKNRQLALRAARESIILLKNANQILPLNKDLKTIAVIGPNADDAKTLLGNYNGTPSRSTTALKGIQTKVAKTTQVLYAKGCDLKKGTNEQKQAALNVANQADAIICVMGISNAIEGEQGSSGSDDRQNLELLSVQQELLETLLTLKKPLVLVLENGSPVVSPWAQEHVSAILEAWYPGEEGGNAIADVLFGDYSPAGRLPITYVKSTADLPPFEDYAMKGRTYRYLEKEPLYPFGFGLSFTSFEYSDLKLSATELNVGSSMQIDVKIKNTGKYNGDEVVQLYLKDKVASVVVPLWSLQGVQRVSFNAGEQKTIHFEITPRQIAIINNSGKAILEPGQFDLFIGGSQPDELSQKLTGKKVLSASFTLKGNPTEIQY